MTTTTISTTTDGGADVRPLSTAELRELRLRAWNIANTHDLAVIDAELSRRRECAGTLTECDAPIGRDCEPGERDAHAAPYVPTYLRAFEGE